MLDRVAHGAGVHRRRAGVPRRTPSSSCWIAHGVTDAQAADGDGAPRSAAASWRSPRRSRCSRASRASGAILGVDAGGALVGADDGAVRRAPPRRARHAASAPTACSRINPELLRAFRRLYGTLWSHGVARSRRPRRWRASATRAAIGCRYCRNVRFAAARARRGSAEDDVDAGGRRASRTRRCASATSSPSAWTDAFLRAIRRTIDPELRARMLREFTPAGARRAHRGPGAVPRLREDRRRARAAARRHAGHRDRARSPAKRRPSLTARSAP